MLLSRSPLHHVLLVLFLMQAAAAGERSLVGHELPSIEYLDTEGHVVRAADHEGSVLVMFGGIPW